MGRSASPRNQLTRAAHHLRCERPPYYLSTPDGPDEPAAGWYLVIDARPLFLGTNLLSAYDTIRNLEPVHA